MKDVIAIAFFEDFENARNAIDDLASRGVSHERISLIARPDLIPEAYKLKARGMEAGIGTAIGSGTGYLIGILSLAIPGFGAIIAAGPLLAALTGAGAGTVTSGLMEALQRAIPQPDVDLYAEAVRRGYVLVSVQSS